MFTLWALPGVRKVQDAADILQLLKVHQSLRLFDVGSDVTVTV